MESLELEVCDYPDKLNKTWPKSHYSHLHRAKVLEGHVGCVNSVSWHPDGQLLATGSDDLNIGLWSYPEGRLISMTRTGHDDNIFASTWLDRSTIVSSARDGLVGLFKITPDGTLTNTKMYSCHQGAAMRLAIDPFDPNFFMSCSRDGTVRQYDVREPHQCNGQCPNVLLHSGIEQIGWHSVSISPIKPEFFAVGGDESFPMIYDRRNISLSSTARDNFCNNLVSWIPTPSKCTKLAISSVCFSPKTMDLAVSYNSGPIFLANPLDQTDYNRNINDSDPFYGANVFSETFRIAERLLQYIDETEMGAEEVIALSQDLLKDAERNLSFGRVGPFRRLSAMEIFNAALLEYYAERPWENVDKLLDESLGMFDLEVPPEAVKTLRKLAEDDNRFEYYTEIFDDVEINEDDEELLRGLFNLATSTILLKIRSEDYKNGNLYNTDQTNLLAFGYHNMYSGHSNHETIKDVSFVGTQGEYVATGSDLGYFFVYDSRTGDPVFIGKGDELVTNVVQSHPTLPVIATSGIEHSVKIWEPSLTKEETSRDYNEVIAEIASRARRPSISCYMQ